MEALKTRETSPCIWMASGTVAKKTCNHYFDCTTCKYDRAMQKNAAAGKHLSWQEAMRCRDSRDRACRHALTGRAGHRVCPMNYNCSRCDFDQTFEEVVSPAAVRLTGTMTRIKGFDLPTGHHFHTGHTWARMEPGGFIRVGMDDFSVKVLGRPDRLELPLLGQELSMGRPGWGINRNEMAADVLSPVNGVITGVNPDPGRHMADSPYEGGWLFTVHHVKPAKALAPLMDDETGPAWLDNEITGLEKMIEETAGPMATDGGLIRADVFGNMPELGWANLTRRFLGT